MRRLCAPTLQFDIDGGPKTWMAGSNDQVEARPRVDIMGANSVQTTQKDGHENAEPEWHPWVKPSHDG